MTATISVSQTARPERTSAQQRVRVRRLTVLVVLTALLLVSGVVAIGVGAFWISPSEVLAAMTGRSTLAEYKVVVDLRLPRVIVAICVGAGLAVAGVLLQALTRNPLASPAVVGVNGGAGLGALIALSFTSGAAGNTTVPLAAFGGAAVAALSTYVLSRRDGAVNPGRFALVGVAIGGMTMAGIQLVIVLALMQADIQSSLRWLTGSLWARTWENVWQVAPWMIIALPIAWLLAPQIDLLMLGDDVPRSLGSRIEWLKLVLLLLAVVLAGSAVAVGGAIAFVGLLAPHLCRRLVGPEHRTLIPAAALTGGLLVLVADTLGRALLPPTEIPVGLFTALIGAPYFLLQIRRGI